MNVFYTKVVSKLLFPHNGAEWTLEELASVRSENSKFKTAVRRMFAPHCAFGLFTLEFHRLNRVVEKLQRSGSSPLRMRPRLSIEMCS